MKQKAKASFFVAAFALAGVAYVPQASAIVVSLGVIDPYGIRGIAGGAPAGSPGSFTDYFNFQVSAASGVGATAISWTPGVKLDKLSLFSGLSGTGSLMASNTPTATSFGAFTSYVSSLYQVGFMPDQWYSLKVEGSGLGNNAMYIGGIATIPVPEPAEWAMLLVGSGLVGFQVRSKQKKLEKTFIR